MAPRGGRQTTRGGFRTREPVGFLNSPTDPATLGGSGIHLFWIPPSLAIGSACLYASGGHQGWSRHLSS